MNAMTSLQLHRAARYFIAAHNLISGQPQDVTHHEPVNLLLGFSAELALKAYLQWIDPSLNLKSTKVRHSIAQLLRLCIQNGFQIDGDNAGALLNADATHSNFYFRYGPQDYDGEISLELLPSVPHLLVACAAVIDLIGSDPTIIRGSASRPNVAFDFPLTMPARRPLSVKDLDLALEDISRHQAEVKAIAQSIRQARAYPPVTSPRGTAPILKRNSPGTQQRCTT